MRGLSSILVLALVLVLSAGAAAQPAGSAAGSADAAAGSAPVPAPAPAPAPATGSAPAPTAASAPAADAGAADELRKTCVAAMNADEAFAGSIIRKAVDTDRVTVQSICSDVDTVATHRAAVEHVEKNQRHVIGAYAAMWVVAALFLLYMFRRQQRLKAELEQLRRDLDAAAKEAK